MCGLYWHQIFLANRNRNIITRSTNFPRVSLKFHVPFDNLFIRWLLAFCLWRIFIMFMLCEGRVRWTQALSTCICSYGKFPIFVLSYFCVRFSCFFFLPNKTASGWKQLWSLAASKIPSCGYLISQNFTRLTRSMKKDLSHKYQLWKLFRRIKKSNCRTCAEGCQMLFNKSIIKFNYTLLFAK